MSRLLVSFAIAVCVASAFLALTPAASAGAASPISSTYWDIPPTGGCPVLTLIEGGAGCGDVPTDPATESTVGTLAEDAEVLPKPWLVPGLQTVALSWAAFGAGWEIGSAIDAKWLHIDGAGLGSMAGEPTTGTYVTGVKWTWYPEEAGRTDLGGNPLPAGWYLTSTLWNGTSNEGAYSGLAGWPCSGDPFWTNTCNTGEAEYRAIGALAANLQWLTVGEQCAIPGGPSATDVGPGQSCPPSRAPSYSEDLGPVQLAYIPSAGAFQVASPVQDYVGGSDQPVDVSSGWANPATGSGITSNAVPFGSGLENPTPCVTYTDGSGSACGESAPSDPGPYSFPPDFSSDPGFGDPNVNAIRSLIDPANWGAPSADPSGSDWATTGGPKVMLPDCYGESVDACEAAIDDAVYATGASYDAAFTEVPATTYDGSLPTGVVLQTTPGPGALANSDYIELIVNEPSGTCYTKTDYPHQSGTRPQIGIDAKASVMCNDAPQTVTMTTYLFECSARPTVKDYASLAGDSDCTMFTGTDETKNPLTVTVPVPFEWFGDTLAFTGSPAKSGYFYIAVTTADNALPSVSELMEASPGEG